MTERHPKDAGPVSFAGRDIERRGMRFRALGVVKDADGLTRRRERAHETLHRFIARGVPVLLDEVLADALEAKGPASSFSVMACPIPRRGKERRERQPGNGLTGYASEPPNMLAGLSPSSPAIQGESTGREDKPGNFLAGVA